MIGDKLKKCPDCGQFNLDVMTNKVLDGNYVAIIVTYILFNTIDFLNILRSVFAFFLKSDNCVQ